MVRKRLQNKEFKEGDKVLLYNSRFKLFGKKKIAKQMGWTIRRTIGFTHGSGEITYGAVKAIFLRSSFFWYRKWCIKHGSGIILGWDYPNSTQIRTRCVHNPKKISSEVYTHYLELSISPSFHCSDLCFSERYLDMDFSEGQACKLQLCMFEKIFDTILLSFQEAYVLL